jgi:homoserine kinase type II
MDETILNDTLESALADYDLTPPVTTYPLPALGINNQAVGVRAGAGDYIWKTYQTPVSSETHRYEHRLLAWLARQGLSFAVAAPLATRAGETLSRTAAGYKALFPLLPGRRPDTKDPAQIEAVGAALGELHITLARYPADPHPDLGSYGQLDKVHPRLPNPAALTPQWLGLPGNAEEVALFAWWREEVTRLRDFLAETYPRLPQQVIHADFGPGNTLYHEGKLSAIIDFEMAGPDARAIDLAAGLTFSMRIWENADPWLIGRSFYRGYAHRVKLTEIEIGSIIKLMLLRDVVSTIWWFGRDLDSARAPCLDRLHNLRQTAQWLYAHVRQFEPIFR